MFENKRVKKLKIELSEMEIEALYFYQKNKADRIYLKEV